MTRINLHLRARESLHGLTMKRPVIASRDIRQPPKTSSCLPTCLPWPIATWLLVTRMGRHGRRFASDLANQPHRHALTHAPTHTSTRTHTHTSLLVLQVTIHLTAQSLNVTVAVLVQLSWYHFVGAGMLLPFKPTCANNLPGGSRSWPSPWPCCLT